MTDEKSEEFKQFILENREMIESILDEEKDQAKSNLKEFNDNVLKILSDDDVQKYFISGCLDFMHFFEAVVDAAPLSPEARDAFNKLRDTRDTAIKNAVVTGAKDKMERITIDDVKNDIKRKIKID